jgi:hypothetical protein
MSRFPKQGTSEDWLISKFKTHTRRAFVIIEVGEIGIHSPKGKCWSKKRHLKEHAHGTTSNPLEDFSMRMTCADRQNVAIRDF